MNIATLFRQYADDFELTFVDDDWTRLEKYFHDDAMYSTSGFHITRFEGRDKLLNALKANISNFDRKCDSRLLTTIEGPNTEGQTLTRTWRSEFTLQGAENLVIEGRERVTYAGGQIVLLEEEILVDSATRMAGWIKKYGTIL